MKESLIQFCESINIDHVGIAPADPFFDFETIWKDKIAKGHITGFEEKDCNKRIYPQLTLESAKSFIVCLFPYYTGPLEDANLSKYAVGIDYHILVKEKLERIANHLKTLIPNFEYQCFCDTGPFSDRYLAYKAGLGFWGINNHIITDTYGSYVFIGYIINNYPFEPDKPLERTCYQCMNCVRKCPGQCILGDFSINAQKCRSYITQKKGELSSEDIQTLKKGHLIWGCDVCQDVCPHNRQARKTVITEFTQHIKSYLEYEELKSISNKEFMRRYKNRAFSWRGKSVLQRNYEILFGKDDKE